MRELADDSGGVVTDGFFYDNVYETYNGVTYEDVIEVSYSTADGYGYSYFGGKGIGESGGSLTGTITGFLDEYYSNWYGFQGSYTIEGISIRMSDLEKAVTSDNEADYIALVMNELAGNDTFTLGQNADYVDAGAGSDRVNGYGGNDSIIGGSGNDTINGGGGVDSMVGGTGSDLYVVDAASDRIVETSTISTEIDTVQSSANYALSANVERVQLIGTGNTSATGNGLANTLTGNSGNNVINGGIGKDTMIGGLGSDTYYVNASGDVVTEASNAGTDTVVSSVSYTLGSYVERLTLGGTSAINGTGNSLANLMIGNSAANALAGGTGNDMLIGGVGNDSLIGGVGSDIYVVDAVGDRISETSTTLTEIDTVKSSVTWTLGANLERLTLQGSSSIHGTGNALGNVLIGNGAANILSGGSGNDAVNGATGNDWIAGGAGNDVLTGGSGLDAFRFTSSLSATSNVDRMADFSATEDRIDLDDAVFAGIGVTGALDAAVFRAGTSAADASDRVIYDDTSGKLFFDADGSGGGAAILFATVTAGSDLTAADIFVI